MDIGIKQKKGAIPVTSIDMVLIPRLKWSDRASEDLERKLYARKRLSL